MGRDDQRSRAFGRALYSKQQIEEKFQKMDGSKVPFLRALIWGDSGSGKTPLALTVADHISAPVLVVSTEAGELHYPKDNVTVFRSRDPYEIDALIQYLAREKHLFKALIIDNLSDLYTERLNAGSDLDSRGQVLRSKLVYQRARATHFARFILASYDLKMHFIVIAESADKTKGEGEKAVTKTVPNLCPGDEYKFDLQIRTGFSKGRPVAIICRDRSQRMPQGEAMADMFGEGLAPWVADQDRTGRTLGATSNPEAIYTALESATSLQELRNAWRQNATAICGLPDETVTILKGVAAGTKENILMLVRPQISAAIRAPGYQEKLMATLGDHLPWALKEAQIEKLQEPARAQQLGLLTQAALAVLDPDEVAELLRVEMNEKKGGQNAERKST